MALIQSQGRYLGCRPRCLTASQHSFCQLRRNESYVRRNESYDANRPNRIDAGGYGNSLISGCRAGSLNLVMRLPAAFLNYWIYLSVGGGQFCVSIVDHHRLPRATFNHNRWHGRTLRSVAYLHILRLRLRTACPAGRFRIDVRHFIVECSAAIVVIQESYLMG